MMSKLKKYNIDHKVIYFIVLFLSLSAIRYPLLAEASSHLSASPVVTDLEGLPRDIVTGSVTLQNHLDRRMDVYVFVNNVSPAEGNQAFVLYQDSDRATSLANWISITRGVIELKPFEQRTVSYEIDVYLGATPGIYHAEIGFGEGSNRDEAAASLSRSPKLAVNFRVLEDIKERVQLVKFAPERTFSPGFPVSFALELENIGNRPARPEGEIRIYNRKGKEVATVGINGDRSSVLEPDAKGLLAGAWAGADGLAFGRYKAFLDLSYGSKGQGTVQDTTFFWVMPWQLLAGLFASCALLVLFLTVHVHRKYEARYHRLHRAYRSHVHASRGTHQSGNASDSHEEHSLGRMSDIRRK